MADDIRRQNGKTESTEVVVEIVDQLDGDVPKLSAKWGSTVFEPNGESGPAIDAHPSSSSFTFPSAPARDAPEKKLTLFALRLAVLEKAASCLGTLGFIWATVVLLGGFAITLDTVDFWVVTTILVIEGARIFSRSHELEWQHQATRSIDPRSSTPRILRSLTSRMRRRRSSREIKMTSAAASPSGSRTYQPADLDIRHSQGAADSSPPRRGWKSSEVPIMPFAWWVLDSASVSRILYWLQVISASTCVGLSFTRLSQQSFGEVHKGDTDKRNRKAALNIFYGLALAEALLFLVEKAYWEFELSFRDLLVEVSRECRLGDTPADLVPIRRFFYDAFSRCIEHSVFDGAKMDLVSFAEELLGSDSRDEQLIGARILCRFAGSDEFGRDTLRKIGTSAATMERLVEMLNWKSGSETELRQYAAEVVAKLASKKQNVLRVAGIPGSMESITSLLHNHSSYSSAHTVPRPHEVRISGSGAGNVGYTDHGDGHYPYMRFNLLGLCILKKLAHNHDNCGKIGNTRDLLPRIIKFTATEEWLQIPDCSDKEARVKAAKRSLQLLKMLANASGETGKLLRREIADIVFTVGNMRDIVHYGGEHKLLQKLAIEILTCLALDAEARGRIGGTGGVIRDLFQVFFAAESKCVDTQQRELGLQAGEALAMLALESRENCRRMLRLGVVGRLVKALRDPELRVNAARILTNLCTYGGFESSLLLRGVTEAAPMVLQSVMTQEKKALEVSAGLALRIFHLMSREETEEAFRQAGIAKTDLAERLISLLQLYSRPSVKEPRIRRYVVELAIWMMRSNADGDQEEPWIAAAFKARGMLQHLSKVAETTSELELYNVFSGSAGLSRHDTTVESLVETAIGLLSGDEK